MRPQDEVERLPSSEVHYRDPAAVDADLYASDLAQFDAVVSGRGIEVVVTMARPFVEGMYTCVHLTFDCDRDPATGVGGAEMYFRAAVGSRFRPSAWTPELPGVPGPLENRRCSYSEVFGEGAGADWSHRDGESSPEIEGAEMRFTVPRSLVKRFTSRYGTEFDLHVSVETACSDQPLVLEHTCSGGDGSVTVDGKTSEWSGRSLRDPHGELHPSVRFLDLTRFRLDHGPERLFACIETAGPGLVDEPDERSDIRVADVIHLLVEPLGSRYDPPRHVLLGPGRHEAYEECERSIRGRNLEVGLPRSQLQGRFRVTVWSEAVRYDATPVLPLDLKVGP